MSELIEPFLYNQILECLKMTVDTLSKLNKIKKSKQPATLEEFLSTCQKVEKISDLQYHFLYKEVWCTGILMLLPNHIYLKVMPDNNIDSIGAGYGHSVSFSFTREESKQSLFTTEDNVNIYEGDTYWLVNKTSFEITKTFAYPNEQKNDIEFEYFFLKECAEIYIELNKPCLSLNDVKSCCHDDSAGGGILYLNEEKLKQLAQQKINP